MRYKLRGKERVRTKKISTNQNMESKLILGLDVGGANTKAVLIKFKNEGILNSYSYIEYFPFWEKSLADIPQMFIKIIDKLVLKNGYSLENVNTIAITITAELSDAFQTKREGISLILSSLERVFDTKKLVFINNESKYISFDEAKKSYFSIAAANWVSTSLFLGNFIPKAVLIDAGSTTIDIIPILNNKPVAKGKTDVDRLMNHELIYTGGLRATIPSITHFVPYKGKMIRISFEKFALISDVHLILHNISEKEYINDTADNRSKSLEDCYARLSRIICMDMETISREELTNIAHYIYIKQLELIKSEIDLFLKALIERLPTFLNSITFVITGLSADFLIKRVLTELSYNNVISYEEITKIPEKINSSAFAVAGAYHFQSIKN